jgi:exodeoxyribonuclease VII small subunit
MTQGPADVDGLGYEQARDELVDVVRRLEAGAATLEESLLLWERGQALASRCEQWLAGARARVDALTGTQPAGGVSAAPGAPERAEDGPPDREGTAAEGARQGRARG